MEKRNTYLVYNKAIADPNVQCLKPGLSNLPTNEKKLNSNHYQTAQT